LRWTEHEHCYFKRFHVGEQRAALISCVDFCLPFLSYLAYRFMLSQVSVSLGFLVSCSLFQLSSVSGSRYGCYNVFAKTSAVADFETRSRVTKRRFLPCGVLGEARTQSFARVTARLHERVNISPTGDLHVARFAVPRVPHRPYIARHASLRKRWRRLTFM